MLLTIVAVLLLRTNRSEEPADQLGVVSSAHRLVPVERLEYEGGSQDAPLAGSGPMIPAGSLLIRVDRTTSFKHVQKIMEFCRKNGVEIYPKARPELLNPRPFGSRRAIELLRMPDERQDSSGEIPKSVERRIDRFETIRQASAQPFLRASRQA